MRVMLAAMAAIGLMGFTADEPPLPGTEPPAAIEAGQVAPEQTSSGQASSDNVITRPDWDVRPSGEDMARYYPERAQRLEIGGRATLMCDVRADGSLTDCKVVEESPKDMGFGDSALKLSKHFRMKPATKDGKPVHGATVRIPLVYKLPEGGSEPGIGRPDAILLSPTFIRELLIALSALVGLAIVTLVGIILWDLRRRPTAV